MSKNITTPSILPGFMELLPADQLLFNDLLDKIRKTYEKFGFIPLDTPMIEKSEILLAKSGGDTEKQIYRFQKGDNDLSLRFDLTVPLARYVAQHFGELTFPFRRYHIGKVFRGERPQRGRFREFYQCDIDIIGSETLSIINEAEILSVIHETFLALGFQNFTIRINNRKILNGFYEGLGIVDKGGVLRVLDKLDKIGVDAIKKELSEMAIACDVIDKIMDFVAITGDKQDILNTLLAIDSDSEMFKLGVQELQEVCGYIDAFGVPSENYAIDLSIARGLDYYTGTIYETVLNDYPSIGSVCSGGRYDALAESYTKQKLPGVGISIGLTRLFYQLKEAGIIKASKATPTDILIIPMQGAMPYALQVASKLRGQDIPTEVYLNEGKLKKQFGYADKLGIPYCIVIGEEEMQTGLLTMKNMQTGTQEKVNIDSIGALMK
ncbi:MAG: histidine--tRNA ligase [Hyphomonadaceae bacterium]|nr:histidine--tRNA ligase [Clostridia bacterium]